MGIAAWCLGACVAGAQAEAPVECPTGLGEELLKVRGLYSTQPLAFDVLRNGRKVGSHSVSFVEEAGGLRVESRMHLSLRLWFVEAYHFEYRSTERWCGDQLESLSAVTNDNGTQTQVSAARHGDALRLHAPAGSVLVYGRAFATNHWHPGVLQASQVLNTLTGQLNRVRLRNCSERLPDAIGAACHEYQGDLQAKVWYDADGHWRGLAFDGRDGSRIEYRLAARSDP